MKRTDMKPTDPARTDLERLKELTAFLNEASKAYYKEDRELVSNLEYDRLYDELEELEKKTGTVLAGSPTYSVGYEVLEELPKERHEAPMLSLNKTKAVEELAAFAGEHTTLLSWKLDGLTVVLTYRDGALSKAVTRGNGEIGEVITPNARVFQNIPLRISHTGEVILRGEAVISYPDFAAINAEIADVEARYKNPRNLASGSVRQLDNKITAVRRVRFYAFSLVRAEGVAFKTRSEQLAWLNQQGFETVEFKTVTAASVAVAVTDFSEKITDYEIPSDGLVAVYDDIAYGQSLGRTAKFPRDSIAFKWQDELKETVLKEIEWSPSRTGLINPVAIFEPVELEGTTVSRASVHNLSILKGLKLGIGDRITVYKANMIIPQIAENLTGSEKLVIPNHCPACGGPTEIRQANDVETLYCTNGACPAKHVKAFALFVSRDALNIDGLSEATLEKLIGQGMLHDFTDLFHINRYRERIVALEGFGEKSYENLVAGIERARTTTLPRLLYGLGIPNIGTANAKVLSRHFDHDLSRLMQSGREELVAIEGMGEVMAVAVTEYFAKEENQNLIAKLLELLILEKPQATTATAGLAGKTFVVTGSVHRFANRNELKAYIEERGGKVTGSVTKKTDYLINNDTASNSSKNKKAKELGIPILAEEDFLALASEGGSEDAD